MTPTAFFWKRGIAAILNVFLKKQEFIEYLFMVHFLGLIFMILFGLFGIIKYGGALIL